MMLPLWWLLALCQMTVGHRQVALALRLSVFFAGMGKRWLPERCHQCLEHCLLCRWTALSCVVLEHSRLWHLWSEFYADSLLDTLLVRPKRRKKDKYLVDIVWKESLIYWGQLDFHNQTLWLMKHLLSRAVAVAKKRSCRKFY